MKSNLHFILLTALLLLPMVAVPANAETPEDKSGETAQRFAREETEWVNVSIPDANTNKVPRVLLVGDSITQGYYPGVEKELKPAASCAQFTTSASVADPVFLHQLQGVLGGYQYAENIQKTNADLDEVGISAIPLVQVLDFGQELLHPDGTIKEELFAPDHIHLSKSGYAVYAQSLAPILEALLNHQSAAGGVLD
jgi:lysophospholipase L1-like esterase